MNTKASTRREILSLTLGGGLGLGGLSTFSQASDSVEFPLKGRLFKTLKIGMVKAPTMVEQFMLAKQAGFGAIELAPPGINVDEVLEAIEVSGLPVDGTVINTHWKTKHSDPKPEVREQALRDLLTSIRETKAVGGHTVLLVVGHGDDGTKEEVWQRSIENIKQALPLCAELGIAIAIENVWNKMCYEHGGSADQGAEEFVKYVDEFDSPWVGMQFDIGNHWKYGNTGDWIRALGKRVIKLDVKGFSRKDNDWRHIGKGDIDFLDVRKALTEINFHGWCAAEVGGGKLERLQEISNNMDKSFGLT